MISQNAFNFLRKSIEWVLWNRELNQLDYPKGHEFLKVELNETSFLKICRHLLAQNQY